MKDKNMVSKIIRDKYAAIANNSEAACCGSGCGCCGDQSKYNETVLKTGYTEDDLSAVPAGSNMALGCGNPLITAQLKKGEKVLDLGSGGGFDCFLASRQVGDTGHVTGVDMTPDMVLLARRNAIKGGYKNVEFRLGEIEHLPVADSVIDIIISNCVLNLSQEKQLVFNEAYRVLKPGGRLAITDIVATAELPGSVREDLKMTAGCVAGAENVGRLRSWMTEAGFTEIRFTPLDSGDVLKTWFPGHETESYVVSCLIEALKL